jgi:hypothetical protein
MMTATQIKDHLKATFPAVKFYAGTINKTDKQCVGVYPKGRAPGGIAVGGIQNTSLWILPLSILVHWSEDTAQCEQKASELYQYLLTASEVTIGGARVIEFDLLDSGPVDLARDEQNICEMVIRLNVIYEI